MIEARVITGMGAVSALGWNLSALWQGIAAGQNGIRKLERFSTAEFSVDIAATVPGCSAKSTWCELAASFALTSARDTLRQAGVDPSQQEVGLVLGTGCVDGDNRIEFLARRLAEELALRGPVITIATACAASTHALGVAAELLDSGAVDCVLAGGADVLTPQLFAGFHALGALSPEPCAPFSRRLGTSLGEGAGFVLLERESLACARPGRAQAVLLGHGAAADAFHATTPSPRGQGMVGAMQSALADAELPAEAIDYINAHGTGTAANDSAEWRAIAAVLGDRRIPVSSSKSFLGHAQGAAGILELIATIACMQRELVPPTLSFEAPRPFGPPDPVAQGQPRSHRADRVLSLSAAFGGTNAAVVVGRSASTRRSKPARPVFCSGFATVVPNPRSDTLESLLQGQATGKLDAIDPAVELPRVDLRDLDRSSWMLVLASKRALDRAGGKIPGKQVGLVVGQRQTPAESSAAVDRSVNERGLCKLSANAFSRIVLSAPAGACSRVFGLHGPLLSGALGQASGLWALFHAHRLLATRWELDGMLAAAVDEAAEPGPALEAAGAVLLAPKPMGLPVMVAGAGLAGAGQLDRAIRSTGAPLSTRRLGPLPPATDCAAPSLLLLIAALQMLVRGEEHELIVCADDPLLGVVAIYLRAGADRCA